MQRELQLVDVGRQSLADYAPVVGEEVLERLRAAAEPLRGGRVLYLNATSYGGGVAELMRSMVPLLRDLGIEAEWRVIFAKRDFFEVTKALHNGLQGARFAVTDEQWDDYLRTNERNAERLGEMFDCVVVHDPQPAAMVEFAEDRDRCQWIWRCHIDTSAPDPEAWRLLLPFIRDYDARVFSMPQFIPDALWSESVFVIAPGIDPLSPKNMDLRQDTVETVLRWIGIELDRPLMCQVARFDPWKDPIGVIDAYRIAKQEIPDLQLALVGSMANDDPEGWRIYREITEHSEGDPEIHVFTNYTGVGNIEVNAFQRSADVVVQKSIREGFGLVVSEALFKGTPVIAGDVGGIPAQLRDGRDGYLVDTAEQCAERAVELVRDPAWARELGNSGRAHVIDRFLLTRLLEEEIEMLEAVVSSGAGASEGVRA